MTIARDYHAIIQEYDSLTRDSADPSKVSELAKIGERLSFLLPRYNLAKDIIRIEDEISSNKELTNAQDKELAKLAKNELPELNKQLKDLISKYDDLSAQEFNSEDARPAIMEFRPGAGGEEAKIWVEDLKRMYLRFAENEGIKFSAISDDTFIFTGKPGDSNLPQGAYGLFKWESGVHRVQRVPSTESQGRIHTSTASIAVLPKIDKSKVEIKDEDLEWQFFRSGGKGGQNVNKVSTAVRLIHKPTGFTVVSTQERYQQRNREIALELLSSQLWEIQEEERLKKIDSKRRSAVGSGARAEKIRTYNYPQNRVTDHRINESFYSLDSIIEGDLTKLLLTLQQNIDNS